MAHAHTRTLLAKLGFADKDRQNSRHDAACNYIALGEGVLARVIGGALGPGYRIKNAKGSLEEIVQKGEGQYATTIGFIDVAAQFDVGHFVSVTPYADVDWGESPKDPSEYLAWYARNKPIAEARAREIGPVEGLVVGSAFDCIIEVKIGPVSSGDLIRQLKLYEEYHRLSHGTVSFHRPTQWPPERDPDNSGARSKRELLRHCLGLKIAVVDYDVDAEYIDALRSAGISLVRLGKSFENYLAKCRSVAPVEVTEV